MTAAPAPAIQGTSDQDNEQLSSALGLVRWAIDKGIKFSGVRPDVKGGVRGAYATSSVQPGEILVAVPLQSALHVLPNQKCPFEGFVPQVRCPSWRRQ